MSQIYVSSLQFSASEEVVKSIKTKSPENKIVHRKIGTEYHFSNLEQSDYVVFVLDKFAWQQGLESIPKGMLSELVWCINHKVPMFLAYKSINGLHIYATEIDDNLNFKGIAGTADNFYQIVNRWFGTIVAPEGVLSESVFHYQDELSGGQLDFLNTEQQKSYFY